MFISRSGVRCLGESFSVNSVERTKNSNCGAIALYSCPHIGDKYMYMYVVRARISAPFVRDQDSVRPTELVGLPVSLVLEWHENESTTPPLSML